MCYKSYAIAATIYLSGHLPLLPLQYVSKVMRPNNQEMPVYKGDEMLRFGSHLQVNNGLSNIHNVDLHS